jgi:hypothetical protein
VFPENIRKQGAVYYKYRLLSFRFIMAAPPGPSTEQSTRTEVSQALPFFFLFIVIVIAMVLGTVTFGSPSRWIGHATTAVAGLVLLALVVVAGAIRSGRIKALQFRHALFVHKIASVCFTGVVAGTFILGLLVMMGHDEPVLGTPHGIVGLIVAVLSVIQMILSLVVANRQSIRRVHGVLGYLIVLFFLFQLFLGLGAARLFGPHF